jgi:hypothetical protein
VNSYADGHPFYTSAAIVRLTLQIHRGVEDLSSSRSSLLRFAISSLASYAAARFFADFLHFRLYVTHERIHIHHFVLGLILMPITWLAFEENRKPEAELLAGAIAGLFLSELKQLILEQWSP